MSIKQAIEALEALLGDPGPDYIKSSAWDKATTALAALRSMPQAEPVAWYDVEDGQIISAPRWYSDGGSTEAPLYAAHVPEANFGNTPPTAPVPPDWSEVGRLLDAVSAAYAGRYMVGTTNWAAFICRQMKQATPHPAPVPAEPVAWAIFTDAGNARMWTTFQPHVQKLADAEGLTVTPLYAAPQGQSKLNEIAKRRAEEVAAMEIADKDGRFLNAQGHQQAISAIDFCVAQFSQVTCVEPVPLTSRQRVLLAQAWTMLEDYAVMNRRVGNDSFADGAEASAHEIKLMLASAPTPEPMSAPTAVEPTVKDSLTTAAPTAVEPDEREPKFCLYCGELVTEPCFDGYCPQRASKGTK